MLTEDEYGDLGWKTSPVSWTAYLKGFTEKWRTSPEPAIASGFQSFSGAVRVGDSQEKMATRLSKKAAYQWFNWVPRPEIDELRFLHTALCASLNKFPNPADPQWAQLITPGPVRNQVWANCKSAFSRANSAAGLSAWSGVDAGAATAPRPFDFSNFVPASGRVGVPGPAAPAAPNGSSRQGGGGGGGGAAAAKPHKDKGKGAKQAGTAKPASHGDAKTVCALCTLTGHKWASCPAHPNEKPTAEQLATAQEMTRRRSN